MEAPSYSQAVNDGGEHKEEIINTYVEIDSAKVFNCYKIPSNAEIVHALTLQFPDDPGKRIVELWGKDKGMWRIETENSEQYKGIEYLSYGGRNIAGMEIKMERRFTNDEGKIVTTKFKESNDLLITLRNADTIRFKNISDEEITSKIIAMDIGRIKRGVTPQKHYRQEALNGNKFFVLTDIRKGDLDKIPQSFDFYDKDFGPLQMWITYKGKKRKCKFCSKVHEGAICPLEQKIRQLEKERDEIKQKQNNFLPYKTSSDSTLRHLNQSALSSDVDAMSGGTTGNIINAIEIDE